MPATYDSLASTVLSSPAAYIDFTSFSSSYTDLRIVLKARSDRAATVDSCNMRWNSDSSTNYSQVYIYATDSSFPSGWEATASGILLGTCGGTSSSFWANFVIDIFNYSTSAQKTCLVRDAFSDNSTSGRSMHTMAVRRVGEAITTIRLNPNFGLVS